MKMNKKLIAGVMLAVMSAAVFTGCGGEKKEEAAPAAGGKIVVISREDGSGTRGAFIELFGIEKKGTPCGLPQQQHHTVLSNKSHHS